VENNLGNVLIKICQLLKKHDVEYIIVGGTAVALHGFYRHSVTLNGEITEKPDLDIWFNPSYANYFKILNVIENLDLNVSDYRNENNPNPKNSFFKLEFDDFTLDILPNIKAEIDFKDAFLRKEIVKTDDFEIFFLNYNDLIIDKQLTARKKDIEDLKQLKNLNKWE